jgi:hypothetical protein
MPLIEFLDPVVYPGKQPSREWLGVSPVIVLVSVLAVYSNTVDRHTVTRYELHAGDGGYEITVTVVITGD